jgi:hypothetical protein
MPKAIRKAIDRASARYAQRVERMETLAVDFVQDLIRSGADRMDIVAGLAGEPFREIIMEEFGLSAGAVEVLAMYEGGVLKGLSSFGHMTEEMLSAITSSSQVNFLQFVQGQATTIQNELVRAVVRDLGAKDMAQALRAAVKPHNADTIANTALNTYSRTVNEEMAKTAPKGQKYIYEGPQDERTRDICLAMGAGGAMTYDEIEREFPSGFGDGGGFNCRHQWTPIEEVDEDNTAKAAGLVEAKKEEGEWRTPLTLKEKLDEKA